MAIDTINSVASTSAASAADSTTALPKQTLDQSDFLKLLVAQMTSQDPMNPESNTDFAAQMAQFSALTTAQSTQSEISQLHADQQIQQANSLIGRAVVLAASDGSLASGTVSAVQVSQGVPQIVVGGVGYDLSQVLMIQAPVTTTAVPPVVNTTQTN